MYSVCWVNVIIKKIIKIIIKNGYFTLVSEIKTKAVKT